MLLNFVEKFALQWSLAWGASGRGGAFGKRSLPPTSAKTKDVLAGYRTPGKVTRNFFGA